MQKTKIHPEGPELSRLVLGAWRWNDQPVDEKALTALINQSFDLGITTIDHADIYGNYECERIFGDLLRKNKHWADKIELVTKCGIKMMSDKYPDRTLGTYDLSSNHIIESAERSLQNLSVDSIDLLLIHRPSPLMNPDEVAAGFEKLRESGKVQHFGVSNFTIQQFDLLQSRLDFPLVTNQLEISLTYNDLMFDGTLDHLYTQEVSPMAWSPLGGGSVFSNQSLIDQLKPLCDKYEMGTGALLISWLLSHPSDIFPVVGTMNENRLRELAQIKEIERQDWFVMLKAARGYDVP